MLETEALPRRSICTSEPDKAIHLSLRKVSMRIQLFITCMIDSLFPQIGEAIFEALSITGAEIYFPSTQTCCGQPSYNAGYRDQAKHLAKRTIEILTQRDDPVVIPSGSCAVMIRKEFLDLFHDNPPWHQRAQALASRTYELSEFLVDVSDSPGFQASFNGRIAYHPSCHLLRGLGVQTQPLDLLNQIEGADVLSLSADCCGFGGVFAIDHPEISSEMMNRKLDAIENLGVDVVVGADVSCLMQIEGGLRRRGSSIRCAHLAQMLTMKEPGLR
jgi:L-lactate dehydrogenase complex protein LldE